MKSLLLAVPCALMLSTANAAKPELALGGSLGMMGVGADVFMKFNDRVNGRLSGRFGSLDADGEEDGIDYNGTLDLSTFGALFDFHPWATSSFRVTGGVYSNSNKLDLEATSPDNAEIGDVTYNITDGKVNSNVSFESTAPYLGIGWGNPFKAGSRWTFMTDIGILFQGSPEARISAQGNAEVAGAPGTGFTIGDGSAADDMFQDELEKEEANLNDELEDFDMLPVVSVGVSYRF